MGNQYSLKQGENSLQTRQPHLSPLQDSIGLSGSVVDFVYPVLWQPL